MGGQCPQTLTHPVSDGEFLFWGGGECWETLWFNGGARASPHYLWLKSGRGCENGMFEKPMKQVGGGGNTGAARLTLLCFTWIGLHIPGLWKAAHLGQD